MTESDLIALGEQLSAENNAAHDLWTWLPSHQVADKHHGDYASEFQPTNDAVMIEALMYIAFLKEAVLAECARDYTTEEKEWFTRCPCGEDHEEDREIP